MSGSTWIQHVNIMVDDLEAATEFYTGVLGLKPISTPELGMPAQFFAINTDQELHVNELVDLRPERAHFCVRVPDFDEAFRRALEAAAIETDTWGKVRRLPTGTMQLFIRDPAGNLIEIASEPGASVAPAIFAHEFVEDDGTYYRHED